MSTKELASSDGAIRLKEILPHSQFIGKADFQIRSCCSQWQECQNEDVYVAIVESDSDGHDFVREAVDRGAVAIVTERLLAVDRPQCIVPDSRLAFATICHALAGNPSQRVSTVGVAGSDGKTVTSHLIRGVFAAAGGEVGLISSIESRLGARRVLPPNEDLNSAVLADQLASMVLSGCSHAVVEMPCEALARHSLAGVELDAAVVTNIRHDNMGFHGSKENYQRAATRLIEYLKPTGFAVLNADDPTTHYLLDQIETPVLTIAMKQQAEITAKLIERCNSEQTFLLSAGGESVAVRTSIIGDQHIYNCMAAAAVGLTSGIELAVIAKGLESVSSIAGRLERVECGQPFNVWIDSSRSPRQLATALQSVKRVTQGKLWCVCSTEDQQTSLHRKQMGEIVEKSAHHHVITQSVMQKQTDFEPTHQVLDGFERPATAHVIPDRFKAIEWALSQAQPNDAVVITGSGERPIARVGEQQWEVCDRDVCQAWLYDRSSWGDQDSKPKIFNIDDYR